MSPGEGEILGTHECGIPAEHFFSEDVNIYETSRRAKSGFETFPRMIQRDKKLPSDPKSVKISTVNERQNKE
jgi:hypothetical protein